MSLGKKHPAERSERESFKLFMKTAVSRSAEPMEAFPSVARVYRTRRTDLRTQSRVKKKKKKKRRDSPHARKQLAAIPENKPSDMKRHSSNPIERPERSNRRSDEHAEHHRDRLLFGRVCSRIIISRTRTTRSRELEGSTARELKTRLDQRLNKLQQKAR